MKRVFDILVAGVCLIVIMPVALLVATAILIAMGGLFFSGNQDPGCAGGSSF